jgi:hypothetical protein
MFGGDNTGGGGGSSEVGKVTPTMQVLSFDEKTRPITRRDLFTFVSDPNNLSQEERDILQWTSTYGTSGCILGAAAGWKIGGMLPVRWIEKRGIAPFKGFAKFGKISFAVCGLSIPFILVQQQCIEKMLALDETKSLLAFHVKRYMITQRSSLLFSRGQIKEVTKEDQQRLTTANASLRQADAAATGTKAVDVNLALQQQVLTPVAQTGYKPMQ